MASLSYYSGGYFCEESRYDKEPRLPKIHVTHAETDLVKFTLTETDVSVANALRRIMLAEVPTLAIEIVNVEENETVLFDEFIAHRMGLIPLSSHGVGDLPIDDGFKEHKYCNCFDGCPYCQATFKLCVGNNEDKVLNVTHFDMTEESNPYSQRDNWPDEYKVRPLPFLKPNVDLQTEHKDNGILITKLKKDQHISLICHARKGIPKYHAKFNPCATALYQFQPIIKIKREMLDDLKLDEKIEFIKSCPRKVFGLDSGDKVQIERLQDCMYCDECTAKSRELGKKDMCVVTMDQKIFHFTVEGVTKDGPRSIIEVVRASLRILDYKLQSFCRDCWGDTVKDCLPKQPYH